MASIDTVELGLTTRFEAAIKIAVALLVTVAVMGTLLAAEVYAGGLNSDGEFSAWLDSR